MIKVLANRVETKTVVLGDEAVALGAVHSGIYSAYGYPGTPSTEIIEYLMNNYSNVKSKWSSNEKTAYEEALGASFMGKRVLVTMKHVGLNVAADPFVNSSLLKINGGLVIAVADDPGMHSSQNEQDSRFYADYAKIPCFEPVNQQEAYDMTKEAFELSEELNIPVMIRLVTRLSHSRAGIITNGSTKLMDLERSTDRDGWLLLPSISRKNYHTLLEKQKPLEEYSINRNFLQTNQDFNDFGVITSGLGINYYYENLEKMDIRPSHLHIGFYPLPKEKINKLASTVKRIIVIEEGYPFIEERIKGLLDNNIVVDGKLNGQIPMEGELSPDSLKSVLNIKHNDLNSIEVLPQRPPKLCKGCPHEDSFNIIKNVISSKKESMVTADIGCYALGAIEPFNLHETIVCMGASITLAKGAADSGCKNVVAIIGDSTFYHSGLTGLVDCVSDNTPITIMILDNSSVAMTGGQETVLPSSKLKNVIEGLGVEKEHIKTITPIKSNNNKNEEIFNKELEYPGVSVIISVRECIEWLRKKRI